MSNTASNIEELDRYAKAACYEGQSIESLLQPLLRNRAEIARHLLSGVLSDHNHKMAKQAYYYHDVKISQLLNLQMPSKNE